jgi:hypothetical protein
MSVNKFKVVDTINEFKLPATNSVSMELPEVPLQTRVATYVLEHNPQLAILTPCYGGLCHTNYVQCLIETFKLLNNFGIKIHHEFCRNDSLVTRARNNLIAKAMNNTKNTHFIFIDSDIAWDPVDILKLIVSDKHIIGGVYPLKKYVWSKLINDPVNPYNSNVINDIIDKNNREFIKSKEVTEEDMIRYNLVRYNVNFMDRTLKIANNITKVRHIATGFMMFKRELLTTMHLAYPETKYVDDVGFLSPEECDFSYALFDCGIDDGHYLSEDWLFCDRWNKIGGDIFIDVSIDLTHTGQEDF